MYWILMIIRFFLAKLNLYIITNTSITHTHTNIMNVPILSKSGFLYGFTNPSMPDLLKIGMTTHSDPLKRLTEANLSDTFRPPTEYSLGFSIKVPNARETETYVHKLLHEKRVNVNREFFRVSLTDVTGIINDNMNIINGEWWSPPIAVNIPNVTNVNQRLISNALRKLFQSLIHLYDALTKIDGMRTGGIHCDKIFKREDFASLPYKDMTASQIHKFCDKQVFLKRDIGADGKVSNFDDKKTITVLRTLLNKIGYTISSTTKKISKKRVYEYKIQPIVGRTDNLNYKIWYTLFISNLP